MVAPTPLAIQRRLASLEARRRARVSAKQAVKAQSRPPDLRPESIRLALTYLLDAGYFDAKDETDDGERTEPAAAG